MMWSHKVQHSRCSGHLYSMHAAISRGLYDYTYFHGHKMLQWSVVADCPVSADKEVEQYTYLLACEKWPSVTFSPISTVSSHFLFLLALLNYLRWQSGQKNRKRRIWSDQAE